MRIVYTDSASPDDYPDRWEQDQIYNGIDVLATRQVLDALLPQLGPNTSATYDFERSLQGPILEMNLRGIRVDMARRAEVIGDLYEKLDFLERNLDRIVLEGVGMRKFNWRSPDDRVELFYTQLGIPPIKKKGRPTTDRPAREKMAGYTIAKPIVAHINAMADIAERIKKLKTDVGANNRMYTSYNIAGTNTGRLSSSRSEFGDGTNLQNVEEFLRAIFIADPGMKWAKFDAKQIQSRIVGGIEWNLFKDATYLDACESSDLHTLVAKLVWPNLPWAHDPKPDKAIAETLFYRHFTRRDLCKKLGHGSNFEGKAKTLSDQTGVPIELILAFQPQYFRAFPAHERWHQWVASQIATKGYIVSITGRKRWFMGRRTDPDVIRGGIAYDPQASESFVVGKGLLSVWRQRLATLMMHEHDGLVYQYPEHMEDELVPKLLKQLEYPVDIGHGRIMTIPYEAKVGWNRGAFDEKTNPEGLKDFHGHDSRKRATEAHILDRVVSRAPKRVA